MYSYRQPVKAVALHAAAADVARERDHLGDVGLSAVEAGVEAGHLRDAWKLRGDRIDGGEIVRLMQWRQRHELPEIGQDLRCHNGRRGVFCAAVHHAVPDTQHATAAVPRPQPLGQRIQSSSGILDDRIQRMIGKHASGVVLRGEPWRGADAFDLSARFELPGLAAWPSIHAELEAR